MTITPPVIALIAARFRDPSKPKLNQAQMADHMGFGRSWASKLMKGSIKNISDEDAAKLQSFLGIKLTTFVQETGEVTPELAIQIGRLMKENDAITKIVSALVELSAPKVIEGPRWIETKDMTKVGQEIVKIAWANEDKPGKVARLVLELLTKK